MKKILAVILLLSWSVLVTGTAAAESFAVNFTTDSFIPSTLAAGDAAGFVPQANWNNTQPQANGTTANIASPTTGVIVDSVGSATAVTFDWTNGNNDFLGSNGTATPDEIMFHGMVEGPFTVGDPGPTITVGNIPYASYDVYVYVAEFASSPASMKLGTEEFFYVATSDFPSVGYVQATATSLATATTATYVLFSGVSGSSFTLDGFVQGVNRAAITGVQVVSAGDVPVLGFGGRIALFIVLMAVVGIVTAHRVF